MRRLKLFNAATRIQKYMKGWKSQKKTLFEYMELKTTQCAQYFKRVKEVNEANARLVAGYYIYKYI